MVQVLRDKLSNTMIILIINSDEVNNYNIYLNDMSSSINFNSLKSLNKQATYQGVNTSINYITGPNNEFGIVAPKSSVMSIFGDYGNKNITLMISFLTTYIHKR